MIRKLLSFLCFRLCVGQTDVGGDGPLPKLTLSAWPSSVVPAKSNVTLRCRSPVPDVDLILKRGATILDFRLTQDSTERTEKTASFHLTDLGRNDAGQYTCESYSKGFSDVLQRSDVLLLLVTGYFPKPTLRAHQRGEVTAGGKVTVQCQMPANLVRLVKFALLKAGAPSPIQRQNPVGKESDFSLQDVTINDTGKYSCVYYQARPPFMASYPSDPLEILVTVSPGAVLSEDYTKGNLTRLAVAAVIMVVMGAFLVEAWQSQREFPDGPRPNSSPGGG